MANPIRTAPRRAVARCRCRGGGQPQQRYPPLQRLGQQRHRLCLDLYGGPERDLGYGGPPVGNTTSKAAVTSNSFSDSQSMSPGSPFYRAYWELFVDAGPQQPDQRHCARRRRVGQPDRERFHKRRVQRHAVEPPGRRHTLSSTQAASKDATLGSIVSSAMAGNQATIWQLAAGGLTSLLPADAASTMQFFVESVWNTYYAANRNGQLVIEGIPGSGLLGELQQQLDRIGRRRRHAAGAVLSGRLRASSRHVGLPQHPGRPRGSGRVRCRRRQLTYTAPNANMAGTGGSEGTSAASPLWAALINQIDNIFQDQRLPNLGYMNDLLYTVAKIAPAAFNDVSLGNNTSSYPARRLQDRRHRRQPDRLRLCRRAGLRSRDRSDPQRAPACTSPDGGRPFRRCRSTTLCRKF